MNPSDFPHEKESDEFAHDIPEFLERKDLAESAKRKILGGNASNFYRL
jgi:predicted TIM-barrel fold metal-dependent hydrolase